MNCGSCIERMSAALDGACTPDELRRLEEHLAQCPSCAQLYRRLRANAQAARELDCDVPGDLKERILSSLPPQDAPKRKKPSRLLRVWAPVAAAACLVLVIAGTLGGHGGVIGTVFDGAAGTAGDNAVPDANHSGSEMVSGSTTGDSYDHDYDFGYGCGSCGFANPRSISVCYGATPEPSARIVGSVGALEAYLAQFESLVLDGDGNWVPIGELDELREACTEEFFQNHRLLCVVIHAPSGGDRYELSGSGLTHDSVTVIQTQQGMTCDMAAWLLVAEVDDSFADGAELAWQVVTSDDAG